MFFKCVLLSLFLCFNSVTLLSASSILAILPVGDKNDFEIYTKLLNELALRGHEIRFLNPFAEESRYNLKLIDISEASTKLESSTLSIDQVETISKGMINDFLTIHNNVFNYFNFMQNVTHLHKTKKLIDFMRSEGVEFDLVIIELFFSDGDYFFGHEFEAPVIAISTFSLLQFGYSRLSNPNSLLQEQLFSLKSYRYGHPTCFWERLINSIEKMAHMFAYNNYMSLFHSPDISNKHRPSPKYIMENTTLILSNSHYTLYGAKSNFPNVVEIGGIHIEEMAKRLSWDLQTFIDGAEHGVIYFCMGSMLKASTIPDDKRDALVKVFSRLPQRVLWKWENDTMPGKSDNVKIAKWMPQRDILAQPNVKLFISHGGLLGTTEAVHCGVPIIGIPFYGDQAGNIEAVASHGAGLRLDYNDIDEHNLYNKITEILNNPQYAENAKALSVRFRDRPQTPLETAVYWTEYVIRHKGAPHLRSAAVDLTWYQYLLLDVLAFILLVSLTTILSFYYTLKFVIRKLFKKSEETNKSSKKVKKS